MKCVSCGAQIDDDSRFCSECGARQPENPPVEAEKEEVTAEAAVTEEITEMAEETAPEEVSEPEIIVPDESEPAPIEEESAPVEEETAPEEIAEPEEIIEPEVIAEPEVEESVSDDTTILGHMEFPDAVSEPETAPEPENDVISVIDSVLQNNADITTDNHIDVSEDVPVVQDKPVEAPKAADLPPLKKREEPAPAPMNSYSQPDYGYNQSPVDNYGAPNYIQQDMQTQVPPPPVAPAYSGEFAESNPEPPIKVGALRLTGASIVSFFTAIIMIVVTLLTCVKLGITGDTLQKRMKKMDSHAVFSAEISKDLSFSDAIYNEAGIYGISEGTIGKELFLGYMCKIGALNFASDYVKEYVDYILTGKGEDPSITNNELTDFFISNNDMAKMVLPYEFKMSDYNKIRSNFQKKDTAANFSISKWSEQVGFPLENLKYIVSPVTIGIFGALLLVLLIWIIVIVDKRGKHLMGFYGGIFCWSGFITIVCGLAVTVGASVAHVFTGMFAFYASATLLMPFALYAVAIGGAEYILGFIFKRIKRAIRVKQKRNAAVQKALADANV